MKIKEVAALTGLTVRTLHYYDQIGLLRPSRVTDAGYRLYDEAALERLQEILFFRELDFPLRQIQTILSQPHYDKQRALQQQQQLLLQKQARLQRLLDLLDARMKGENTMQFEAFDDRQIEALKQQYAEEAAQRYGGTAAYAESQAKTGDLSSEQWKNLFAGCGSIFQAFADCRGQSPDSDKVQALVEQWKQYITDHFYSCTDEILAGLGQMYTADERFTKTLDAYGVGTAQLMADAIAYYTHASNKR